VQFRELCQAPTGSDSWKRQYEAELRTLQAGLDLLLTLQKAVAREASGLSALELEDGQ